MVYKTGCWKCKHLAWFDDGISDNHPTNESWSCYNRENIDIDQSEEFPCIRLLKCYERLEDKSLNII